MPGAASLRCPCGGIPKPLGPNWIYGPTASLGLSVCPGGPHGPAAEGEEEEEEESARGCGRARCARPGARPPGGAELRPHPGDGRGRLQRFPSPGGQWGPERARRRVKVSCWQMGSFVLINFCVQVLCGNTKKPAREGSFCDKK